MDIVNKCVCAPGTNKVLNQCIACPSNSVFDNEDLECKCQNNTVKRNGRCVSCGTNKVYDPVYKICVCELGSFKADDGSCVKCAPKMAYINGQCQCIYNYFEESPGICKRCLRETDGPRCRRNVFWSKWLLNSILCIIPILIYQPFKSICWHNKVLISSRREWLKGRVWRRSFDEDLSIFVRINFVFLVPSLI